MKPPAWLAELHRQWFAARGLKLQPSSLPFLRDWQDLLDAAGLRSAADRNNAEIEARRLASAGHLELRTKQGRAYILERIAVPVTQERWLIEQFGGTPAGDLHKLSREIAASARSRGHPRLPASWEELCDRLLAAFDAGKHVSPFSWKDPQRLRRTLEVLHGLTVKEWPAATLIRDASSAVTADSKYLEKHQRSLESALSLLFGEEFSLEALGILSSQSRVLFQGSLCLHFSDGTVQTLESRLGEITLSYDALCNAELATTLASRILTIENTKTTFHQAAAVNGNGETLLIATSYPNAATRRLLELLPANAPHYHFGDTDASGYAILRSLREIGRRSVKPFLMEWRDAENSKPLSEHDRRILPALLASPLMADCHESLKVMQEAGRKGRFEQEAYGTPKRKEWPFWGSPGDFGPSEYSPAAAGLFFGHAEA